MAFMKYGRREPKRSPSLKLAGFLKAIPSHPLSEDYLVNLSDWQMLGNDQYGDCACVGWSNIRRFVTALLGDNENYPGLNEVLQLYKTQNPSFPDEDNGMDMQTMLEYLNKKGGPDGVKLVAFASVDTSNLDEVKAALYIFGSILLGVEVQGANQQDFAEGKVWDYHAGQPIEGGHCVLGGGYLGKPKSDIRFITWGAETGMTDSFWNNLVNCPSGEAWVCIWPENLGTKQFVEGIDMATLATDYKALTGRTLPVPVPVPVPPAPVPIPNPIPTPIPTPPPGGVNWLIQLFNWIISLLKSECIMIDATGIDVSSWEIFYNPPSNPPRPINFVIQRSSYGLITDTTFESMQANVLKCPVNGAYHYLSSAIDWKTQADYFLKLMNNQYDTWGWDVEKSYNTNSGVFIGGVLPALEYIYKNTGKPGLFYMNPDMWSTWYQPIQSEIISFLARTDIKIGLWVAHYWNTPNPDLDPNYWTVNGCANMPKNWKIWQYDCNGQGGLGKQYGVGSLGLDLNKFNGTIDVLNAWISSSPVPIPSPAPVITDEYYVNVNGLNVRKGPGSDTIKITTIWKSSQPIIHALGNTLTNGYIQLTDKSGWVFLSYLIKK